ncbi:MAG: UMP kinase [bacterium]|nr:UMP kinase [bacterium]
MKNVCVIALGGSLVVPHLSDSGGVDVAFLKRFRSFLLGELKNGRRVVLVVGGGKIARMYNASAARVVRMTKEDLDWIGIHATRLNAHLLRTIFVKTAYPVVLDHDPSFAEAKRLRESRARLFIASGWRPGWSTDYIASRLARKFGARDIVDAGDIPFVYDEDPKKNGNAKPIVALSWKEYRRLIPQAWSPGMAVPFDPVASRLAQKEKLRVKILDGRDLKNMKRAINGESFKGTLIS